MYKDLFPNKKRWIKDTVSDDGYPFPDNRHKGKKNNNNNNNNNNNDNDNDNNNNNDNDNNNIIKKTTKFCFDRTHSHLQLIDIQELEVEVSCFASFCSHN